MLRPDQTDVFMPPDIATLVSSNVKGFSPVASLASGLGWFEHQGKMYQTYFPPDQQDGRFRSQTAYRATALNLSQITRFLEARTREEFVERNCLPGAVFEDFRLRNAQDISP